MTSLITRAATALRSALKADVQTTRFLEKTYVDVRLTARHWGA
jgi:hypothetical protein